ncbi:hypothetical protein Bhyg_00950 [Pseudolycoriella hygida]|uniref:Uncharacterized protein n=1 Tax=Pseudolycoriella hygida TaxID=35572 RepID=A0A9Q0N9Y2_9DIPT|nr:hypothetical protein Bhyg_00950 [Pseudolycoriella hygida]
MSMSDESGPVYQFLPPREGYVPVYIRLGDTPLDEINPDLALAFHESNIETRNGLDEEMQNDAPNNDDLSESIEDAVKEKLSIQKDLSGEDSEEEEKKEVKSSDDASDSEERFEPPQKKSTEPVKPIEEEEETVSEEKPASTETTKENDSEETPANKEESGEVQSEEMTKDKQKTNATPPTPPPISSDEEDSGEEIDD